MTIRTVLGPAEIARLNPAALTGSFCVVFDILRATSAIVTALAHGVRRVFAVSSIEEARQLAAILHRPVLAGERRGEPIPGFDCGNSPQEFLNLAGRDIVTTTTNGTPALRACASARCVLAAALLNLQATAQKLAEIKPDQILLVCAGTGEDFALEDAIGAGELAARLADSAEICDATRAVLELAHLPRARRDELIRLSRNGRVLAAAGRQHDISWCLQRDVFDVAACFREGAFQGG